MHGDDRSYRLWTVRPDGSGRRQLDAGGRFGDGQPFVAFGTAWDWSPDRKQIAFVHADAYDGDATPSIYLLDVLTGRKRRLTTGTEPVWSPGGTRIAFADRCRLWLVPANGGKRTPVTPRPKGQRCLITPDWSPDGRWIAARDSYGNGLPVVTRFNGKSQRLARPIRPAAVKWPRDCKRVFFYAMPHYSTSAAQVGWVVHGPQGLPRYSLVYYLPNANLGTNLDWRC
jgi:hypothetical protein